jgi:hypothetical protein
MPTTPTPINSKVVAITGFTHRYLVNEYKIPTDCASLCYQGIRAPT